MIVKKLDIPDVLLLSPSVHEDSRGFLFELFNQREFNLQTGLDINFVQDNISNSKKGVLRGLHYQESPMEQGKLVSVINGAVHDVAVDIRKNSSSYGKWVMEKLTSKNKRQLWIPPGFAHGFYSLNEETTVLYKTTNFYSSAHEKTIKWDDKNLKIEWGLKSDPIISNKDKEGENLII
tara:strand:+ start:73 stop:606 length:534 start_codon:yes stop_codon:yes gene_type:complete